MRRYKYVDVARGIGMMLVISAHSAGLNSYLIYFFMQLFFILSGWLYQPGRTYGENIKKKAWRLLIPYFGYSIVLLVFYFFTGRSWKETMFSAIGILYSRACLYDTTTTANADNIFFFNIANGGMWYLTAYFMASVVFYLVIDKCMQSKKYLYCCIFVLTALTMALAELPVLLPWSIDVAFVGALFMIMGALLRRTEFFERKKCVCYVAGTIACYLILVTINPNLNTSIREYGIYGRWSVPLYILIGISGSIICIWIAQLVQETMIGHFLEYIGKNTIILLAFHILGLEVFEMFAEKLMNIHKLSGMWLGLYHVIRITVSICGCLMLGKFFGIVKGKVMVKKYEY